MREGSLMSRARLSNKISLTRRDLLNEKAMMNNIENATHRSNGELDPKNVGWLFYDNYATI